MQLAHRLLAFGLRDSHVTELTGLTMYDLRLPRGVNSRTGRPCASSKKLVANIMPHAAASVFVCLLEGARALRGASPDAPLAAEELVAAYEGLLYRCPNITWDAERLLAAAKDYVAGRLRLLTCGTCRTRHVTLVSSDRACPMCRHAEAHDAAGGSIPQNPVPKLVTGSVGQRHARLRGLLDSGAAVAG